MAESPEDHKSKNNAIFKRVSSFYDLVVWPIFSLRKKVALIHCGRSSSDKVLDVACGTGAQSIEFAKRGALVTAVDLSPDMLSRANVKAKNRDLHIDFTCCDATKLKYKDSKFDSSSISFAIHDMPFEIGVAVLKEMRRVTKPGGLISIVDYRKRRKAFLDFVFYCVVSLWETEHFYGFRKRGILKYIKEAELEIMKREYPFWGIFQIVSCRSSNNK